MTWILVALASVALILLIGDAVFTRLAERRAARLLGEMLDAERTRVSASSWPAALLLLTSVGSEVKVVATTVPVPDRGCDLSRLELDLHGMHLVPDDDGRFQRLEARSGRFTAHLEEEALVALTPVPGLRGVDIRDEGVRYRLPGGVRVDGAVSVDGAGALVFTPKGGPLGTFRIAKVAAPVGRLPLGATIEWVETRRGEIVVGGALRERSFDLGSNGNGAGTAA
jgi:hypothetical protein